MFENPRRGRQARSFTTNAPKILDLKSSSEEIFSRKLPLGAAVNSTISTILLGANNFQAPVVQKVDSAIYPLVSLQPHGITQLVFQLFIRCIVILYPVGSAM